MQASFKTIDNYITEDLKKVENTVKVFSNIRDEVTSIASISENQYKNAITNVLAMGV